MKRLYARFVLWLLCPALELNRQPDLDRDRAEWDAYRSITPMR